MTWAIIALLALPLVAREQVAANLTSIEFRALSEDGQPILDLTSRDVTVKVNGRTRPVQSITTVRIADRGVTPSQATLPLPYATNAQGVGTRTLHILLDEESIEAGHEVAVKETIRRLLDELSPGDRVGVRTPQGQVNLRPTDDLAAVRVAVDRFTGHGTRVESAVDAACRTQKTLFALGEMLNTTSDGPTTILIFSSGVTGPTAQTVVMGTTQGTCTIRSSDFQDFAQVASSARVEFYVFQTLEGRQTPSSMQSAGLESLAGVLGAEFVRLTGGPSPSVARLLRETTAYSIARFVADPSDRGRLHVEVRVDRERVRLRARPALTIATNPPARAAASPQEMLRVATSYRDLPLRAAAYSSRNAGDGSVKIVALFETIEADPPLKSAAVALFDEKGTLKKQWSAQPADLTRRPVMAALVAPPGAYRMRVAAVDAAGRAGTTDSDVKAEVVRADPLKLSALVLGVQVNGSFAPRLQFGDEPIAIGLVEIYGAPKNAALAVDLDVVARDDAAPLASAPTTLAPTSAEDTRVAFGGFSIDKLPPGDYLMRAVVTLDGKPVGRVVRTLRKTGKY